MFESENLVDFDFSINKQYAERFEHNKKREDLHRCKLTVYKIIFTKINNRDVVNNKYRVLVRGN